MDEILNKATQTGSVVARHMFVDFDDLGLPAGYAHDLVTAIQREEATEQDADSLFRTLVLDEAYTVGVARDIYEQAMEKIERSPFREEVDSQLKVRKPRK